MTLKSTEIPFGGKYIYNLGFRARSRFPSSRWVGSWGDAEVGICTSRKEQKEGLKSSEPVISMGSDSGSERHHAQRLGEEGIVANASTSRNLACPAPANRDSTNRRYPHPIRFGFTSSFQAESSAPGVGSSRAGQIRPRLVPENHPFIIQKNNNITLKSLSVPYLGAGLDRQGRALLVGPSKVA